MWDSRFRGWVIPLLMLLCTPVYLFAQQADIIIQSSYVWTGLEERPWAGAVAIQDNRILAVGAREDIAQYRGESTEVLDVKDMMVMPGFIDNHTHFNRAGSLLLGVNLLAVSDTEGLVNEVRAAADRLPDGAWLVGGDWGAYKQWAKDSSGESQEAERSRSLDPDRTMIDSVTPKNPALLSRWDGERYLANNLALQAAGAECSWEGVECIDGRLTGRLTPVGARRIRSVIPEKSMEQRMAEARIALERLRKHGVTTIHDITGPEQMRVFYRLKEQGELTARIYARPTLDKWEELDAVGIEHGFGDEWLKIGGLKGFMDGIMGNSSARFYEPYLTSGERGRWRDMMYPPGNMKRLLLEADSTGYWPQVHAIGDQAIDSLLTLYEYVIEHNPPRERRFRVIHTQVLSGPDVADRMARNDIIAEVQPYHAIDDMRWMEERIGDRSRWAYAFRTLDEAGVRLSFGSDWPGTNASWYTSNPIHGIYAAVARQTLDGTPEEGWYPQERIDRETALRAYTVNNAFAAGEEKIKGKLKPGMLADLVVVSSNLFTVPIEKMPDTEVVLTMVDGKIVYRKGINKHEVNLENPGKQ